MNYMNMKRGFLSLLMAGCLAQSSQAMLSKSLLALTGDACLCATAASLYVKNAKQNMSLAQHLELRKQVPPSVYDQVCKDVDTISPYVPLLLPVGVTLSVGARLGMVARGSGVLGKVGGLFLAGVSMRVNPTLILYAYGARLQSAMDNAGVKDSIWNLLKKK
jgi:hypothetical protein